MKRENYMESVNGPEKDRETEELILKFEGKLFKCPNEDCGKIVHENELTEIDFGEGLEPVCPHCQSKDKGERSTGGWEVHPLKPEDYESEEAVEFMRNYKEKED